MQCVKTENWWYTSWGVRCNAEIYRKLIDRDLKRKDSHTSTCYILLATTFILPALKILQIQVSGVHIADFLFFAMPCESSLGSSSKQTASKREPLSVIEQTDYKEVMCDQMFPARSKSRLRTCVLNPTVPSLERPGTFTSRRALLLDWRALFDVVHLTESSSRHRILEQDHKAPKNFNKGSGGLQSSKAPIPRQKYMLRNVCWSGGMRLW
jgi:hypothetical protein